MTTDAGTSPARWVGELELAEGRSVLPVRSEDTAVAENARVFVLLHGSPLGHLDLPAAGGQVDGQILAEALESELGAALEAHLRADALAPGARFPEQLAIACALAPPVTDADAPPISVIIATRNRPDQLAACLTSLQRLDYPNFEVLVVDNAPSDERTAHLVEDLARSDQRLRYLREQRPGASRAKNRGLAEAAHGLVALTDDDVLAEPGWLRAVARGFARGAEVGCVTGLVPAASLVHPAQRYFEAWLAWSGSLEPRVYDLGSRRGDNAVYPYSAGIFGTGANCAFDRALLEQLGGFDEALGPGTPAAGAEDLDLFVRTLFAERAIAYEPSSIVWHVHRDDSSALERQIYGYGLGLTAFFAKHLSGPESRAEVLRRVPEGALRFARAFLANRGAGDAGAATAARDARYRAAEVRGMLAGPFAYRRGRRQLAAEQSATR